MKNIAIIGIVAGGLLHSCATAEQCARKFPSQEIETKIEIRDSIITRDTLIYLPADSLTVFIPCPEPSVVPPVKGGSLTISVKPVQGGYIIDCSSKVREFQAKLFDRLRQIDKSHFESNTIVVYKMNDFQRFFFNIGLGLSIYFILKIIFKLIAFSNPSLSWVSFILRWLP